MTTNNASTTFIAGCTDAIRLRAGLINPSHAHPAASEYAERGRTLPNMMEVFHATEETRAASLGRPFVRKSMPEQMKTLVLDLLRESALKRMQGASSFRKLFATLAANDFKGHDFPAMDFVGDFSLLPEGGVAEESDLALGPRLRSFIQTWGRNWYISDHMIVNDEVELLAAYAGNFGLSMALRMAANASAFLESNPAIHDGKPMFDADLGSRLTGALSVASLGAAVRMMRIAKSAAGLECGLPAKYLVTSADLEVSGTQILDQTGLNSRIELLTLPSLPIGRWYLFADPEVIPAAGFLTLGGGIAFGSLRDKKWRGGILVGARADFNFVPLGRLGVVQGGP